MLVIEDDEPVRSTLVDILELNASSAAAANGTADLASARRDRPALIIADGNMPGMTGVELLATFRGEEALRAIPVSVISAKVDRPTTRRGLELGAADFITKPISEAEGLHSIAPRLEKKGRMDELDAFAPTAPTICSARCLR
jgi:CheY-like chemotaxis protein